MCRDIERMNQVKSKVYKRGVGSQELWSCGVLVTHSLVWIYFLILHSSIRQLERLTTGCKWD